MLDEEDNSKLNCNGDSNSANSNLMMTRDEELKLRDFSSFGFCEDEGTTTTARQTEMGTMDSCW